MLPTGGLDPGQGDRLEALVGVDERPFDPASQAPTTRLGAHHQGALEDPRGLQQPQLAAGRHLACALEANPAEPSVAEGTKPGLVDPESVEDLRYKLPGDSKMSEEDKKAAREAFTQGWLAQWAATISDAIEGPFLAGDAFNVADIKVYVILRAFLSGTYDHIPASVFEGWPKIGALYAAVDAHPAVRGWFDRG